MFKRWLTLQSSGHGQAVQLDPVRDRLAAAAMVSGQAGCPQDSIVDIHVQCALEGLEVSVDTGGYRPPPPINGVRTATTQLNALNQDTP